ncbi:MAG: hypothetical protein ACYS47_04470 [Planctomycetota bacterium]
MITINLLGKTQLGLELEWEVNEALAAKKGFDRWNWEFEVRRSERLRYCISGENEMGGTIRYVFNESEVVLELMSHEGDTVEIEGTFKQGNDVRIVVGEEQFDSRGALLEKGNPFHPENLYGLISLAIQSAKMPTPADAEAYRARLVEAVRFGRKKLRAANRYFSPIVKKILPKGQSKQPIEDFQKTLNSVDFALGGR